MRAAVINNWNLERGIVSQGPDRLSWKAVTTGNYGGLDLWLEKPDAGRLRFRTAPVTGELAIAELGMAERVFAAGGLERAIKLHRLPAGSTGATSCCSENCRCEATATPARSCAYSRRTATACGRARSICFAEAARTRAGRQADRTGAQWATVRRD